ncbi:MAG: hypothetical protein K0R53_421 [Burkholderiales bacterium]|jgi:hypothetical protein|nr:hypothetical protein [Burkholderiales bacterium]
MKQPGWKSWSIVVLALLAAAPGWAAETVPARSGVSFVSGGVGENSVAALKARENEFNLKLVFTLSEGAYLADVGVRVADAAGKTVIEHVTEGPIFMARLPSGTYNVTATYNGRTQTRKLTVGERLQTAYLRWPSEPGRDVTLTPQPREAVSAGTIAGAPPPAAGPAVAASGTGVKFIAGEVGENAEQRIKAAQQNFNLKLVFTLIEGNYVADVDVAIKDTAGKTVLQHHVPGPFLLADLPSGTYDVTATYEGKPHSRKVRVGNRLSTEYFRWPSNPNADYTLTRERLK